MPTLRERLDAALARLAIGEDAVMTENGRRMMVVSADFVTTILGAGEKVIGPAIGAIHYLAGERSGQELAERARAADPRADPAALVARVMGSLEVRAFGRLEVADLDVRARRGTLRLYRSAYADAFAPRDRPVCHGPAGLWAGLLAALSGAPVVAEEVRCRARGDPHCEIVAGPQT